MNAFADSKSREPKRSNPIREESSASDHASTSLAKETQNSTSTNRLMKTKNNPILPLALALAALGFSSFVIQTARAASWVANGPLVTGRYAHAATLLPNGKVLVTGGYDCNGFTTSAELYDPATGSCAVTSPMGTARYLHKATLLLNGKVLVAGGYNSGGYQPSAELYDPATGTWTATGSMNTGRDYYTATLLLNGKVLAAGTPDEIIYNDSVRKVYLGEHFKL